MKVEISIEKIGDAGRVRYTVVSGSWRPLLIGYAGSSIEAVAKVATAWEDIEVAAHSAEAEERIFRVESGAAEVRP